MRSRLFFTMKFTLLGYVVYVLATQVYILALLAGAV